MTGPYLSPKRFRPCGALDTDGSTVRHMGCALHVFRGQSEAQLYEVSW